MAPLTNAQMRVDKWSKLTLIGSTLLFVFSLMTYLASHGHHHGHHGRGHEHGFHNHHDLQPGFRPDGGEGHHHPHEGHIRLNHFAILGLLTSVTGIASSFKLRRTWAVLFLVAVLVTEVSALGFVGYKSSNAAHKCLARSMSSSLAAVSSTSSSSSSSSTSTNVVVSAERRSVKLPNGDVLEGEFVRVDAISGGNNNMNNNNEDTNDFRRGKDSHSHSRSHSHSAKPWFARENDPENLGGCLAQVRHVGILASLIVGVIACSLACCGSRFSNSLAEREEEEIAESAVVVITSGNNKETSCVASDDSAIMMAVVVPAKEQPATIVA